MATRKRRRAAYTSGHCAYPSQGSHGRCSGAVRNGAAVKKTHTVCACSCHGDYETRLAEYGQAPAEETPEEED